MKTITLTAAEEKLVMAALQQRKNAMTRESKYLGVTATQRKRLEAIAVAAKRLQHKIINTK